MQHKAVLVVDTVYKRYPGALDNALSGVSCDFMPGEVVSLLGVNGAGKTTLSALIAGQHPVSSGDIRYHGVSIYQDITRYRRQVGYCQQKVFGQTGMSLYELLKNAGSYFGLEGDYLEQRMEQVATECGIIPMLPRELSQLSGGYRQRFSLARSMMHDPALLILDEPTVALDPHVRHQVWDLIARVKEQGKTVILTTHYLDEAEVLSDRVCILERGKIKLIDTPAGLLQTFGKQRLEEAFMEMMKEEV
jgi:ABC-type multidrug transport system ATPase subunit